MDIACQVLLILVAGYLFSKYWFSRNKDSHNSSLVIQIDDKNFIVNNEFISFEEDTLAKRFSQEIEDRRHYVAYESQRLQYDRERILNDWMQTHQAIIQFPDLLNCITYEKMESITKKYDEYVNMCDKLGAITPLDKSSFLILQENPLHCMSFKNMMFIRKPIGCYMISNEKTAKYIHGDMLEMMKQEFKEKWY